jgi:hypothetical protein
MLLGKLKILHRERSGSAIDYSNGRPAFAENHNNLPPEYSRIRLASGLQDRSFLPPLAGGFSPGSLVSLRI